MRLDLIVFTKINDVFRNLQLCPIHSGMYCARQHWVCDNMPMSTMLMLDFPDNYETREAQNK